jgi:hypothetical protein
MKKQANGSVRIFSRYITRNGKRIYHPTGGLFTFLVPTDKK